MLAGGWPFVGPYTTACALELTQGPFSWFSSNPIVCLFHSILGSLTPSCFSSGSVPSLLRVPHCSSRLWPRQAPLVLRARFSQPPLCRGPENGGRSSVGAGSGLCLYLTSLDLIRMGRQRSQKVKRISLCPPLARSPQFREEVALRPASRAIWLR